MHKRAQGYNSKAKFLYVSTNLNSGNAGMMCRTGWSDLEKTKAELAIIEKVLLKLRDGIAYKPYFSRHMPINRMRLMLLLRWKTST